MPNIDRHHVGHTSLCPTYKSMGDRQPRLRDSLKDYALYPIIVCMVWEAHMRTTLDLPRNLLDEAMKVSNTATKTGVIIKALEELVRKSKISNIKKYKGKFDLDMDLDEIRNRR